MKRANPNDKGLAIKDTDEPELEIWEIEYIESFYMLNSSRSSGMGIGAIPLSEILLYCEFFNIEEPLDFIRVIQAADNAYLDEYRKTQDKEKK